MATADDGMCPEFSSSALFTLTHYLKKPAAFATGFFLVLQRRFELRTPCLKGIASLLKSIAFSSIFCCSGLFSLIFSFRHMYLKYSPTLCTAQATLFLRYSYRDFHSFSFHQCAQTILLLLEHQEDLVQNLFPLVVQALLPEQNRCHRQ